MGRLIKDKYEAYKAECNARFAKLKANEEELNRIFIDIYGLQDELTPEVADKDVTVHYVFDCKDDVPESMKNSNYVRTRQDEIKSLISYAVGCMFGRYSLDVDGLAYAGGEFSGQCLVDSGKCIVDSGQWIVDSDQCLVDSGKCVVDSGQCLVDSSNHSPLTTNHSTTTNHSQLTTNHSSTTNHSQLTTNNYFQWLMISGQYYRREVVEKYVSEELQRALGMAEVDGFGNGNLYRGEAASERGVIFTFRPDETSGCFHSVKYCRGASKKFYEGISPLSINCKGLKCGAGNTAYDLCSPEILNAISNQNGNELVQRGWEDAQRIDWKAIHYALTTKHFSADKENIIPICDDDYFDDDITGRFIKWVETVYGSDTLEENLHFIADALGGKGTPREVIRSYFLNDFYADHLKIYQKRPIYWLFDSGKKNGFKALIYMHRYQPDLLARMRTDYVHEQQERYRTQLTHLTDALDHASASERVKLNKQITKLKDQTLEIQQYEEKVHHLADQMISIDLDDGVKVNYAKFKDILAKIK